MTNPFDLINAKLCSIEELIQNLNVHQEQDQEEKDELFSVQEAASFLKLTVPTIYSKVSRGELPVMKRGKRLYFSREELMNYLKEGKQKSQQEIAKEAEGYLTKKGRNHGK